jgi:glutathione S-transferase
MMVFVRENCAFSRAVLSQIDTLKLDVEKKFIEDPKLERELMARGGRIQVPFFVDEKNDVELYDSDLILHYLDEHYGPR